MDIKKPEVGAAVQRALSQKIRSVDEKNRTITFVASDESVDRYGDIIRVAGWDLEGYRRNPVFLWGHRSGDPPIGRTVKIWTEKSPAALVQTVEFASADVYPFAATVFALYKGGFLNAVSVGFRPTEEPKMITDEKTGKTTGYEFIAQELLELSAVAVPANKSALMRAFEGGEVTEDIISKCFGEKNPPWSYSVPGATIPETQSETNPKEGVVAVAKEKDKPLEELFRVEDPNEPPEGPEDEPAGSLEDLCEEVQEDINEIAVAVGDAQGSVAVLLNEIQGGTELEVPGGSSLKVPVTRNSPALGRVIDRIVETRSKLGNIALSAVPLKWPELGETTARIEEMRIQLSGLATKVSELIGAVASKQDSADWIARSEELRGKIDKLFGAAAKESSFVDLTTRIDEVRVRLDKQAGVILKKSDLADINTKQDAARVAHASHDELSAKKADVDEVASQVDAVMAQMEVVGSTVANRGDVVKLNSRITEGCSKLDSLASAVALEATLADSVTRIDEIRTRVDGLTANTATKADIAELSDRIAETRMRVEAMHEKLAEAVALLKNKAVEPLSEERSVCPYTDDAIAPKGTAWDAGAEMAKQSSGAGWKHMSTVIVGDPSLKGSYKLPHHKGSGFDVVPNGVRAALGRLEQTQMPSADRAGARSHLTKHQKKIAAEQSSFEFDAQVFEQALDAMGRVYRAAVESQNQDGAKFMDAMIQKHVDSIFPAPKNATLKVPEAINTIEDFEQLFAKSTAVCKDCGHLKSVHTGGSDGVMSCTTPDCKCAQYVAS